MKTPFNIIICSTMNYCRFHNIYIPFPIINKYYYYFASIILTLRVLGEFYYYFKSIILLLYYFVLRNTKLLCHLPRNMDGRWNGGCNGDRVEINFRKKKD